jgi:hypothetical protein
MARWIINRIAGPFTDIVAAMHDHVLRILVLQLEFEAAQWTIGVISKVFQRVDKLLMWIPVSTRRVIRVSF